MADRPRRQHYMQEQSRAKWTTSLTKTLVDLMVEQALKGSRTNNSFGKKAWKNMCDEFCKRTGLNWGKEQLKNRYGVLRRQYITVKSLLYQGGFSWNESTQIITATDEVWDKYIQAHPDAEAIRSNGCPIYKQLCTVFSDSGSNGNHHAESEMNEGIPRLLCIETPTMSMDPGAPSNVAADESSSPIEDEDINISNGQHKHESMTPPSSGHQQKRSRRGIESVMAEAIIDMAAASRWRTATVTQSTDCFSITNCIKALDEMEGLEERIYFAALDLFDSSTAREIFLSLRSDRRLTWLKSKCCGHRVMED
ncbi:L10-interacting MYB domain-containing protein-like [Telopea speciosissima]|uniref:L10-interacting MYB domain-containing protein-like n=1 Tax=Telopea speciosissima TaxID=54955 RepID=UPI001CC3AF7E|nr:L10-interacting MYB domain-containing protein-like [Telopea speciosissima]